MSVTTMALKLLRLPAPHEQVAGWHVSPVVDVAAYHFSWLLILIPLALSGETHPSDYLALWACGITVSFVHRHFTMPYVYLDSAVFKTFKTRFTLFPAVLFCGFLSSVLLQKAKVPREFFTALDIAVLAAGVVVVVVVWWRDRKGVAIENRALAAAAAPFVAATVLGGLGLFTEHHVAAVVVVGVAVIAAALVVGGGRMIAVVVALVFAGVLLHAQLGGLNAEKMKGSVVVGAVAMVAALWNIWHTAAQKVGILRVYNAKSQAPVERKVPLWVDRLLVLGWFPLLAALLVTRERQTILTQGKVVRLYLEPVVDGISALAPVLIPVGVVVVVGSLAAFIHHERKSGVRSVPRWSMALGMTLLSASFLFVSPLKCYVAYGFSHAIEYVVFVWAFQRRRYAMPLDHRPLLQRMLRYGWLFYGLFVLVIAGTYFYVEFGIPYGFYDGKVKIFDYNASLWLYAWAIWHSLTHFYFDGFLWKMRAPVRASL
jgi:hypothetical protein